MDGPSCRIIAQSRLFKTPCFPAGAGPDYVNAAIAVETTLSPVDLMTHLHGVENTLGRKRAQRWGNRTMDLDLLAYGDRVLPDLATFTAWRDLPLEKQINTAPDVLISPHPRLAERAFVLIPLMDIAADWVHPVSGLSVRQMAQALPNDDKQQVIPINP